MNNVVSCYRNGVFILKLFTIIDIVKTCVGIVRIYKSSLTRSESMYTGYISTINDERTAKTELSK